eukprot:GHVU01111311.1.p2 GENE.GHVU01111311.1~~GHVU01111311.1.p2  ORF type:complete len:148 (-),score=15.53 GHVU01111311.1:203-646(-)
MRSTARPLFTVLGGSSDRARARYIAAVSYTAAAAADGGDGGAVRRKSEAATGSSSTGAILFLTVGGRQGWQGAQRLVESLWAIHNESSLFVTSVAASSGRAERCEREIDVETAPTVPITACERRRQAVPKRIQRGEKNGSGSHSLAN